jgi:thymidylate synthase
MKGFNTVNDVRKLFLDKHKNGEHIDTIKSGKMLEVIGLSFVADEDNIFGKINYEYAEAEVEWFKSMSRNVDGLFHMWGKKVQIWDMIADNSRNVNSNYGYLAMHPDNGSQTDKVIATLKRDRTSRQAAAIYTRPSIHEEWNVDGMSDFICTNAVMYNIRDNVLSTTVQMRSNDIIFGFRADMHWHKWCSDMIAAELGATRGPIFWQVASAHMYERHFKLLDAYKGTK